MYNNSHKKNKIEKISLILSIGIYYSSFFLKGFETENYGVNYGYELVIYGGILFLSGGAHIVWIANPLLIISWFLYKKKIMPFLVIISLGFGIYFLNFEFIYIGLNNPQYEKITSYGIGYYLWISSIIIMICGFVAKKLTEKNEKVLTT